MRKWIEGFENLYEIDSDGYVVSYKRKEPRRLTGSVDAHGYVRVTLTDGKGKQYPYKIHRLVAEHFIDNPKPDEYTAIDHIDEDMMNNCHTNLRWCSISENLKWWYENRRKEMAFKYQNMPRRMTREEAKNKARKERGKPIIMNGKLYGSIGEVVEIIANETGMDKKYIRHSIKKRLNKKGQSKTMMYKKYVIEKPESASVA